MHDYQGGLFHPYNLTIIQGTTKRQGKEKVLNFETKVEMEMSVENLLREKKEEGYQVLYSYHKTNHVDRITKALWKTKVS
ncbi:MAG: hypothetical protein JXR70_19170 [Spirochaetales bacterium]|nr:hypothetical protein [Spirochaetales bacterium]